MERHPEQDIVKECLLEIERKLGWGNSQQWHNEVFTELSVLIQETTQVLLSPTTLKRIWGKVNYDSAPSITTLNVLSQFAGFENWRNFKLKSGTKPTLTVKKKALSNHGVIIATAALLSVLFISLFSMIGLNNHVDTAPDYSLVNFTSRPVVEGVPNSVIFDFDLDHFETDSIYIQQFWDPTKTIKINSNQQQATGIYYFPGYFRAKLLVDGEIIKEHDLFIKAPNWVATIDYEPVPKFVTNDEILNKGLSLPEEILNKIITNEKPLVSTYHLVDDFGDISGDNFELETTIRNAYNDNWAVCQTTRIVILGTSGAMIIPFSIPGCVSDIGLMLNELYFSGKEHDLSKFGVELSEDTKIGISLRNKEITVSINDKEVYTRKYQVSIGRFVGIRYRFLGAGEVLSSSIVTDASQSYINLLDKLDPQNDF